MNGSSGLCLLFTCQKVYQRWPRNKQSNGQKACHCFLQQWQQESPPPPRLVLWSATGRKDSLVQSRRIFSMITPTMSSTNRLLKIPQYKWNKSCNTILYLLQVTSISPAHKAKKLPEIDYIYGESYVLEMTTILYGMNKFFQFCACSCICHNFAVAYTKLNNPSLL